MVELKFQSKTYIHNKKKVKLVLSEYMADNIKVDMYIVEDGKKKFFDTITTYVDGTIGGNFQYVKVKYVKWLKKNKIAEPLDMLYISNGQTSQICKFI